MPTTERSSGTPRPRFSGFEKDTDRQQIVAAYDGRGRVRQAEKLPKASPATRECEGLFGNP